MAIIEKGILGGFSGKVGKIVGSPWRDKYVIRSVPKKTQKKPTAKQQLVRARFSLVTQFLNPLRQIVGSYYGHPQKSKSPYDLAVSYHLREAIKEDDNTFSIDYPKVIISKGVLTGIQSPELTSPAANKLHLDYVDNSGLGLAKEDDLLLVVAYAEELNQMMTVTPAGTRAEGSVEMEMPVFWSGKEVQVWAFFTDADGKRASTSTYLGEISVT